MLEQSTQLLPVEDLSKIFEPYTKNLGHYNQWLRLAPPTTNLENNTEIELVSAASFFDPAYLKDAITRWGASLGTADLKVAASLWSKNYSFYLFAPVAALFTLGGVGLSLNPRNLSFVVQAYDGEGQGMGRGRLMRAVWHSTANAVFYPPRCASASLCEGFEQQGWVAKSVEEFQELVFTAIFREHFEPLYNLLHEVSGVSTKILWGNLGAIAWSTCHLLTDDLGNPAAINEDAPSLLHTTYNPFVKEGKNPFYQAVKEVPVTGIELPEPIRVRNTCCLWYKVPEKEKCLTCPLEKPDNQLQRWKIYFARAGQQ